MIELLRECQDAFGNIHTYAHKTDFVLKESSDMLKRLDAALAGKDGLKNAAPQPSTADSYTVPSQEGVGQGEVAGAAPGLPSDYEIREAIAFADAYKRDRDAAVIRGLQAAYLRAVKERDEAHLALDAVGLARGAGGHSVRYRIGQLIEQREAAWAAVKDVGRTDMEEDEWRKKHAATIAAAKGRK